MKLSKRLRQFFYWSSERANLGSERKLTTRRRPREYVVASGAPKPDPDPILALFRDELEGSSSLNQRGTTLAALTGATIALLAGFTADALATPTTESRTAIEALFLCASGLLLLSASAAVLAVFPISGWREHLRDLQDHLANPGGQDQQIAELADAMLEQQRRRNEFKAACMRWAYLLLSLGLALVIAEAVVLVEGRASSGVVDRSCGDDPILADVGVDPRALDVALANRPENGKVRVRLVARNGKRSVGVGAVEARADRLRVPSRRSWQRANIRMRCGTKSGSTVVRFG